MKLEENLVPWGFSNKIIVYLPGIGNRKFTPDFLYCAESNLNLIQHNIKSRE